MKDKNNRVVIEGETILSSEGVKISRDGKGFKLHIPKSYMEVLATRYKCDEEEVTNHLNRMNLIFPDGFNFKGLLSSQIVVVFGFGDDDK